MTGSLSPEGVAASLEAATIVDAREAPDFARGHPSGALCVPYSERGFATRVRAADPATASVVLVAAAPDDVGAARQLAEAGIGTIGSAPADADWWAKAGVAWQDLPERSIDGLAGSDDVAVVDVREPMEWETGHVPGAILVALGDLPSSMDRIPRDREVVLICEAGVRSATAASILQRAGLTRIAHAPDGTAAIRRTGGPLEYPRPASTEAS